jgi:hypothetical protein
MLAILSINRRIVTADAIQIHREICVPVFEAGGGYILSVKDNQPPSPRRRPVISCITRRSRWNSCQPQSENETARPRFPLAVLTIIQYAFLSALTSITGRIAGSIRPNPPGSIDRFLEELSAFKGRSLVILSEGDNYAVEFKANIMRTKVWERLAEDSKVAVLNLPTADHNFTRKELRDQCRNGRPTGSGHSEITSGCRRCWAGCPVRGGKARRFLLRFSRHVPFASSPDVCGCTSTGSARPRSAVGSWSTDSVSGPLVAAFFHDAILN